MLILKSYQELVKDIEDIFNSLNFTLSSNTDTEKFIQIMDKIEEETVTPSDLYELMNVDFKINNINMDHWLEINKILDWHILYYLVKFNSKKALLNNEMKINNKPEVNDIVIYLNNVFLVTNNDKSIMLKHYFHHARNSEWEWKEEDDSDILYVIGKEMK